MNSQHKILSQIQDHQTVIETISDHVFVDKIITVCKLVTDTLTSNNKVLLFGNGGSASDAQHIAAEFTGRFVKNRRGYPAIALTTDTSALTAIANDYGFEYIFARQVEALAQQGDLLIGISTSGNSPNVVNGLLEGKRQGCKLVGFTGGDGGQLKDICDVALIIDSKITARIQEAHILIGHIICSEIDDLTD
ncbi:MAG: D-sedoheptulose 7-phosphate isomerase [Bacteroidota bacterium]